MGNIEPMEREKANRREQVKEQLERKQASDLNGKRNEGRNVRERDREKKSESERMKKGRKREDEDRIKQQ